MNQVSNKEMKIHFSEAYKKWRTCDRKKSYETLSKANEAAKRNELYVYECPYCFTWHLTKQKQ